MQLKHELRRLKEEDRKKERERQERLDVSPSKLEFDLVVRK